MNTHPVHSPPSIRRLLTSRFSYIYVTSNTVDPSNTLLLGSCTGSLAAAAASASGALSDLPVLGAILVRIAFRTGVRVAQARGKLQRDSGSRDSWSEVVAGTSESSMTELLQEFHENEVRSYAESIKDLQLSWK